MYCASRITTLILRRQMITDCDQSKYTQFTLSVNGDGTYSYGIGQLINQRSTIMSTITHFSRKSSYKSAIIVIGRLISNNIMGNCIDLLSQTEIGQSRSSRKNASTFYRIGQQINNRNKIKYLSMISP